MNLPKDSVLHESDTLYTYEAIVDSVTHITFNAYNSTQALATLEDILPFYDEDSDVVIRKVYPTSA